MSDGEVRRPATHSLLVRGIGGEPVHGFGGNGHQTARPQYVERVVDGSADVGHGWSDGADEPEHGVDEAECLGGGEMVDVAEGHEARRGDRAALAPHDL